MKYVHKLEEENRWLQEENSELYKFIAEKDLMEEWFNHDMNSLLKKMGAISEEINNEI